MEIQGGFSVSVEAMKGMDLETMMMAVQSNRANLLETQLKDQIAAVQAKNDQISKLNTLMGTLNGMAALAPGDAKADTGLEKYSDPNTRNAQYAKIASAEAAAGLPITGDLKTKGNLDKYIQEIKSQIDSMSNSQQMDMLRLQSLSNKRNEAFDLMTNFVKKMSDGRASIIGNMR